MGQLVTRFPNGVTNVAETNILADFGAMDPTKFHTYFNDFDTYAAADWVVTETQAAATEALADGDGGLLLITNTAADNDLVAMQKVGSSFKLAAGKKAWFKARFKVSDATQSDVVFGLQVTDTTPLDVTDGIYFLKADDAKTVDIICRKNATTGSSSATSIASLSDDTFVELAWFFDGVDAVYYAVGGVVKGKVSATSAYLPDTDLTVSFALQNGEAVAKTMTVDYVFASMER